MKSVSKGLFLCALVSVLLTAPSAVLSSIGPPAGDQIANGSYEISVLKSGQWMKAGSISFDKYLRQKTLDLSSFFPLDGERRIRITQKGGGNAHIDAATLGGVSPVAVGGLDNVLALQKLSTGDFDIIDAFGKTLELVFPEWAKRGELSLTARVEATKISTIPFQFPLENLYRPMSTESVYYTYRLGQSGPMRIENGQIAVEGREKPLFRELSISGSGHPSSDTVAWVANDEKNLYIRLDFTGDNTMDGTSDYAKIYARVGSEMKEFTVSTGEQRWGQPEFTYTEEVAWQHKLYHFRVPLKDLGEPAEGEELQLAFAAYGTLTPPGAKSSPVIAYDSINNQYLCAFREWDGIGDNLMVRTVSTDGVFTGTSLAVADTGTNVYGIDLAYDDDNGRFLIVWGDNRNTPTESDLFAQLIAMDPAPSLYGSVIPIMAASQDQDYTAAAYDSDNQRFLVVWEDSQNTITSADIMGQLINADGSLNGTGFAVISTAENQGEPDVAWDSVNDQYLVTWQDSRYWNISPWDIEVRGSILDSTGGYVAEDFLISEDTTGDQESPAVAFDMDNSRYLVVWKDERNGVNTGNIYGQLVDADGDLLTTSGTVGAEAIQFSAGIPYIDRYADVTGLGSDPGYLVVWTNDTNAPTPAGDIHGQLVRGDGTLYEKSFVVYATSYQDYGPSVAYNSSDDNAVVALTSNNDIELVLLDTDMTTGGGGGGGCGTTGPPSGGPDWPGVLGVTLVAIALFVMRKRQMKFRV